MQEMCPASKREERESEAHFFKREKEGFEACMVLGKSPRSNPRLSLAWGKLLLRDLGLGMSVGEDRAFSTFHGSSQKSFL